MSRTRTASWFETKVKYDKMQEDGCIKTVREQYVFDSLTFTEAEAQTIEELSHYIDGDYKVIEIKPAPYADVIFTDGGSSDKWYKAKVMLITTDEKTGKEKRQPIYYLVQAFDLLKAVKLVHEQFTSSMMDYEIASVVETKIIDVYEHKVNV